MICIECTAFTEVLYVEYGAGHIELAECKNCGSIVDPYVEFDNILLFIDLLLLKQGSYRHIVYNVLQEELRAATPYVEAQSLLDWSAHYRNVCYWIQRYGWPCRVWTVMLAFEVYLTWVTAEYRHAHNQASNTIENLVFNWSPLHQYVYFLVYCVVDMIALQLLLRVFLIHGFWREKPQYAQSIISYAILLSFGVKIFPILMLIWPYDNLLSMKIIKSIANIYLLESLRTVTQLPYWCISVSLVCVALIKMCVVKYIMISYISNFKNWHEMVNSLNIDFFDMIFGDWTASVL